MTMTAYLPYCGEHPNRMLTRVVTGSMTPRRTTRIEIQSLQQSANTLRPENAIV